MNDNFAGKYFEKYFIYALSSLFIGIPFLIYFLLTDYLILGVVALAVFSLAAASGAHSEIVKEMIGKHQAELNTLQSNLGEAEHQAEVAQAKEELWKNSLKERASGFPTLWAGIAELEELIDKQAVTYLQTKSHPAYSAAELVKQEAQRRRVAEFVQKKTQSIIEYYENIAPFLLDFKEQEIDSTDEALQEYSQEEHDDPVTNYLTKTEYRKLSTTERNQMALERFWNRKKSKWLIGRIYERYVGYLYEQQGYSVEYTGIFNGLEDLGRDLVCSKDGEVIIIQCKYWAKFKTIFENHIFQFFGTVFQYRDANPHVRKVRAIFYTTTEVSELAKRFANELNIELVENFKMDNNYPCIKCNVSDVSKEKIYHLPFDQQYDKTRVEPWKGEFYCTTVAEAEKSGFRRAYRWKGSKT